MFPLWDIAIEPVLEAAGARRVVEIGALRGETTVKLLDRLGPNAEIHVVDPVPMFDPSDHERQFPGRYIFHRDISHNVLPTLPPVDAALIDGDHNWYTVYHELKMLAATAREAGAALPLLVMHDVGWPYGRRDLYYTPEQIPDEFRQPYAQRGMRRGRKELVPRGGFNPTMNNALEEGGPRNGVMTALEDFIAEHDRPVRTVVLPLYFSLAIVADEERLASTPDLAKAFDRLESRPTLRRLLALAETLRLKELLWGQGILSGTQARVEQSAKRYLELLKGGLLDEQYLENEVRLRYLAACVEKGSKPEPEKLRDPPRYMPSKVRQLQDARRAGCDPGDGNQLGLFPYAGMGRHRLEHLERCLEIVRSEAVEGDFVECGTRRGGGAIFMRGFAAAYDMMNPHVWVADLFRGSVHPSPRDRRPDLTPDDLADLRPDLDTVRDGFARFGLLDERVRFLLGSFGDTLPPAPIEKVALLRVDAGDHESTLGALDCLYDKVAVGGFVVIDDYHSPEVQRAVDEFRAARGVVDLLERVDAFGACWRKTQSAGATSAAVLPAEQPGVRRAPLPPPLPASPKDLSVVVVFYNMRREAERTLHSLSRSYQRGIDGLDYEVIVLDNGSERDQRLDAEFVGSFGPEFRFLDLGEDATPSPADALNRGIALAAGKAIALMIDGAHVLTPSVLRYGMLGLDTYEPAIVATQQWYVGPGQQGDVMAGGYDRDYEDRLFQEIEWPNDGYRLFDIGHFIGERDWLDGLWESNCIFVPRRLLDQVGGMDEIFSMPGGGYVNLDFYERLGSTPGVTLVSILGEASFHQVHGGVTTNQPEFGGRNDRLMEYRNHYEQIRGRTFTGSGKLIHYVGSLNLSARRTRARYLPNRDAFRKAAGSRNDGSNRGAPVPDDLKDEFTDAFWQSRAWQQTTWLGHKVGKAPTDLVAYQEIINEVQPDWIIETRTAGGGRALFCASMCDLVGQGQVVSIDHRPGPKLPEHPRITYLKGNSLDLETVQRVRDLVGEQGRGLVILGSRGGRSRMVREFDTYAPFVPVGSYVVMEDTILNGHPVLPEFGPGPGEAVNLILRSRGDFAPDPRMEKYVVTFNPRGFLKRLV